MAWTIFRTALLSPDGAGLSDPAPDALFDPALPHPDTIKDMAKTIAAAVQTGFPTTLPNKSGLPLRSDNDSHYYVLEKLYQGENLKSIFF